MEGMEDVLLPPAGGGRCWVSITPPRTGLLNTIGGSTGGGALLIARITGALITLFSNSFFYQSLLIQREVKMKDSIKDFIKSKRKF